MARLRFHTLAAMVAAAVMLAACGGGDDADEGAGATPAPTMSSAPEPAASEAEDAGSAEQGEPKNQTYRVKEGDSLFGIARKFGTSVRALVRLNDIDDPDLIRIGQELEIPPTGS